MKRIPTYVITGFLGTGKTTVLNQFLIYHFDKDPGVIFFEQGQTPYSKTYPMLVLSPFDNDESNIQMIKHWLQTQKIKELWLEWNGMAEFSKLEYWLLNSELSQYINLKQVIFTATLPFCQTMLNHTGTAILSQVANANQAIVIGKKCDVASVNACLKPIQPKIQTISFESIGDCYERILQKRSYGFKVMLVLLLALILFLGGGYSWVSPDTKRLIHSFLITGTGIFFQALPFLLLGSLISSILQVFMSPTYLERWLTGHLTKAIIAALLGGLVFPVCDCAAIPIVRSLLLRKVPTSIALLFMLASPILNPIVIIASYYAFYNMPFLGIWRIGLGLLGALIVSASFWNISPRSILKESATIQLLGNIENNIAYYFEETNEPKGRWVRSQYFLEHSWREFVRMCPYLMIGALVASLFQVVLHTYLGKTILGESTIINILLMMGIAFAISLCTTADAMVARNFMNQSSMAGIIAFLLVGPMMDFKNFLLLRTILKSTYLWRLTGMIFMVSFLLSLLFASVYKEIPL